MSMYGKTNRVLKSKKIKKASGKNKKKKSKKEKKNRNIKSRDITLPTKVCLVKAMVFPVVMYECESWPVKKTEH